VIDVLGNKRASQNEYCERDNGRKDKGRKVYTFGENISLTYTIYEEKSRGSIPLARVRSCNLSAKAWGGFAI